MSRRTIVGSGPARKPLPYGTDEEQREALTRAIRCCEFWGSNTVVHASMRASEVVHDHLVQRDGFLGLARHDDWWPARITFTTVDALRDLLHGMPPRAER